MTDPEHTDTDNTSSDHSCDQDAAPVAPPHAGVIDELWRHPWGRVFAIAITIAAVSWAVRETAAVTLPIVTAVGEVLLPLAIGFTIAYVLNPLVDWLQRRGWRRPLASVVLFAVVVVTAGAGVSLALPAVVGQTGQLLERSFAEQRFVDYDGDGRQSRAEPTVIMVTDRPGLYVDDRDGDGMADPDEPLYAAEDAPIAVAPSIARGLADWVDQRQSGLERLLGRDLDARALRFVDFYRRQTEALRGVLEDGMRVARDGLAPDAWPEALQVDPAQLPALSIDWDRSWPGVEPQELDEAVANLAADDRERWRRVMAWYGRLWLLQHRQLVATWGFGYAADGSEAGIDPTALPLAAQSLAGPVVSADPVALEGAWRSFATSDEVIDREASLALFARLEHSAQAGEAWARALLQRLRGSDDSPWLSDVAAEVEGTLQRGLGDASSYLADRATAVVTNVGGVLTLALDLVLIPIYAFFISLAMPKIRAWVKRSLPRRSHDKTERLLHDIEKVVAAFFRGRLIVCLLCGLLVWAGFALCGVPYPGLFGLLIGLATAVPLSGLLLLVPACLLVVIEGGDGMAWRLGGAIAVYTAVQTLEMTVLTPTIMGHEVELHPLVLILALILFGKLLGVLGLILAVPIAATLRILVREYVKPWLNRRAASRAPPVV